MKDKYIVSEELYKLVKHCVSVYSIDILPKGFAPGEVDRSTYVDAMEILDHRVRFIANFYVKDKTNIDCEPDLFSKVVELSKKYFEIQSNLNIGVFDEEKTEKVKEIAPELFKTEYIMCVLRDLRRAKRELEVSLKYYKDVPSLNDWDSRFEEAFKERNIEKIVSILNEINELNKQTIIDFVNNNEDDSFAFIGHSLKGSTNDLRGTFYTKLVSTSLFTSEFTDTFNCGYGYIMSPATLVSATPDDSYTNNNATGTEDLTRGNYIPRVYHPQEIIEIMRKHKEENEKNDESKVKKSVYSEIVIDGFAPIGIFCFTNGLKELDDNFRRAQELKENSPGLELRVIDVLKYKKGKDLEKAKLGILLTLQEKLVSEELRIPHTKEDISIYEYFFKKFDELKKGDYTSSDIKKIYLKTRELLSTNTYELFEDKEYSVEETIFILRKGYKFNVDLILSGKASLWDINKLSSISEYVKNEKCKSILDKYYPGLAEFSVLITKVNLTEEMYNDIKKQTPLTFASMNSYLYKIVKEKVDQEKAILAEEKNEQVAELTKKQLKLEELYKRKAQLEKEQQQFVAANQIERSEFRLPLIEMDIRYATESKTDNQILKDEIEEKLASKLKEKEIISANNEEYERKYKTLTEELAALEKHPLINRKKIKSKRQEIKELLKNSKTSTSSEIEMMSLDYEIGNLQSTASIYEGEIQENNNIIEKAKKTLKELFGVDGIEEAKKVIAEAKEILESYDSMHLIHLEQDIETLLKEIATVEEKIRNIEEQEANLDSQKPNTL